MSSLTPIRSQDGNTADSAKLAETAQKVVIDIFRKRDLAVVDRYFGEPFVQHDLNIPDGLSGMKVFVSEVARYSESDVTIYRTLVDGDRVLLHSRHRGH